jgi:hypothetical protein
MVRVIDIDLYIFLEEFYHYSISQYKISGCPGPIVKDICFVRICTRYDLQIFVTAVFFMKGIV